MASLFLKSGAEIGLTVSSKEGEQMLTDAALKHLRPKEKSCKVTDRDGMYVLVSTKGSISFRLDYRMNGR